MALPSTLPQTLKNVTTDIVADGTNYCNAVYGNRQRPWAAGYSARARAEGAATLYGINHPGETSPRVVRLNGAGAAASASPFTYTIDATAIAALTAIGASLPQTTAFTTNLLLNAAMVIYPRQGQASKTTLRRIAKSATVPTVSSAVKAWFQITGANTINLAYSNDGATNYLDLPLGWQADLILPDMSTVLTLKTFAAAGEDVFRVTDFIDVASAAAQTVALDRIFQ